VDTSRNGDGRIAGLGRDLNALSDIRRNEKAIKLLAVVGESIVDTVAGRRLAKVQGLPVSLILDTLGLERSEETILTGPESRVAVGHGVTTLRAGELVVIVNKVLQRTNSGVVELRQVGLDVVVEVNLDVGVLGLIGEATGGTIIPVPAVGADDGLVVGNLGVVDDGGTSRLDELDDAGKDLLLLGIGVDPETLPGETESGALEGSAVRQELGVSTLGGQTLLGKSVVVSGVDTVDGIKSIGGIADSAAKGANGILVLRFGNDTSAGSQTNSGLDANNGVALSRVDDYTKQIPRLAKEDSDYYRDFTHHFHRSLCPEQRQ
jgi:hypothetical protein